MAASLEAKGAGMLGAHGWTEARLSCPYLSNSIPIPSLSSTSPPTARFGVSAALGLSCFPVDWFPEALGTAYRFVAYLSFGLRNTKGPRASHSPKNPAHPHQGRGADK